MATTNQIIGARVKALLEAHAMSQTELASRLRLDPGGLSRAISGDRTFKALEVALIAETFGVSAATILDGEAARDALLTAARKSVHNPDAIVTASKRAQTFVELAEMAGTQRSLPTFDLDVPAAMTYQAGHKFAGDVLAATKLGDAPLPLDLHDLARLLEERLQVQIALEPLGDGLDGLSIATSRFGLAMVSSSIAPARQRWTVAHEIGHLLMRDTQELLVDENVYGRAPQETRANAFAASFLMPADLLKSLVPNSGINEDVVVHLLDTFGVSLDALAFRLHNVGAANATKRDWVRSLRPLVSMIRNQANRQSEGYWLPTGLTDDVIKAYMTGNVGIRWLAALIKLDPDDLLDRLQSDAVEAEALEAAG